MTQKKVVATLIAYCLASSTGIAQTPSAANNKEAPKSIGGATTPLSAGEGFAVEYGTTNLATPPKAIVQRAAGSTTFTLSIRPDDLKAAQERRTQPPANLAAYQVYRQTDDLHLMIETMSNQAALDPTIPVLFDWNHVALDMTSIDHTTAGVTEPVAGFKKPQQVFEKTYAEQFGPPRSARAMAIVHLAMFEAANTLDSRYASYKQGGADLQSQILKKVGGPRPDAQSASLAAAISEAGYQALLLLYPRKADFLKVSDLQISVEVAAQEQARGGVNAAAVQARLALGKKVGKAAAEVIWAMRKNDNADYADKANRCQRKNHQPLDTVIPYPLCLEPFFNDSKPIPFPSDPSKWTIDVILPNPVKLGGNWGLVKPFVLNKDEFVKKAGLELTPGTVKPVPKATDPEFTEAMNNGEYGGTVPDPRGNGKVAAKYGVRLFGANGLPAPGAPVINYPPGQGDRYFTKTDRSDPQTEAAEFWGYDATSLLCAPPRLYNMVATSVYLDDLKSKIDQHPNAPFDPHSAVTAARYLALVNLALADAGVSAWNAKYTYMWARPITFLRHHVPDAGYADDKDWTPLGQVASNGLFPNTTPQFPAYPSGHAVFGGAAFEVMEEALGNDRAFDFVSDEFNGRTYGADGRLRPYMKVHFASLETAKWENAESRVWLGVHWQTDADDGAKLGTEIGKAIVSRSLKALP